MTEDKEVPMTLAAEPAFGPRSSDTMVSWVYALKKEQLTEELRKFRLDEKGPVEKLKKRLVAFFREGRSSPRPQLPPL